MSTFQIGQHVRIQTDEPESAFNGTWGIVAQPDAEAPSSTMIRVQGQIEAVPFDSSELTVITQNEADAIAARERANGEL